MGVIDERALGAARGERGGAATTFALIALPLALALGLAVDHIRGANAKSQLADAARAAAIAAAAETDEDARLLAARRYLQANLPPDIAMLVKNVAIEVTEDAVVVAVDADLPTSLLRAAGYENLPLAVERRAPIDDRLENHEIALAFDPAMPLGAADRRAAFEDALRSSALDAARMGARVAIMPYGEQVNIAGATGNELWRDWLAVSPGAGWKGCVAQRRQTPSARYKPYLPSDRPFTPVDEGRCEAGVRGLARSGSEIAEAIEAAFAEIDGAAPGRAAADSGLAWAYRALSPDWARAWGDLRAPASWRASKHAVLILDGRTPPDIGARSPGRVDRSGGRDQVPKVLFERPGPAFSTACRYLSEYPIELHVVWFGAEKPHLAALADCASRGEDFHRVDDVEALASTLAAIVSRRAGSKSAGSP